MCNAAPLDQGGLIFFFFSVSAIVGVMWASRLARWLGDSDSLSVDQPCDLPKAKSASKAATIRRLFFRGRIVF